MSIERIQQALREEQVDGWLFYDFRRSIRSRMRYWNCRLPLCIRGVGSILYRHRERRQYW